MIDSMRAGLGRFVAGVNMAVRNVATREAEKIAAQDAQERMYRSPRGGAQRRRGEPEKCECQTFPLR